jgi:hypothetical protein
MEQDKNAKIEDLNQYVYVRPVVIAFLDNNNSQEIGLLISDETIKTYIYPLVWTNNVSSSVKIIKEAIITGSACVKDVFKRAYEAKKIIKFGQFEVNWYEYEECFVNYPFYCHLTKNDESANILDLENKMEQDKNAEIEDLNQYVYVRPVVITFLDNNNSQEIGLLISDETIKTYIYPLVWTNNASSPVKIIKEAIITGSACVKDVFRRAYEAKKIIKFGQFEVNWYEYEECFVNYPFYCHLTKNDKSANILDLENKDGE